MASKLVLAEQSKAELESKLAKAKEARDKGQVLASQTQPRLATDAAADAGPKSEAKDDNNIFAEEEAAAAKADLQRKRVRLIKAFCESNNVDILCLSDYDCNYDELFAQEGFLVQASLDSQGKEGTALLTLGLPKGEAVTTARLTFGEGNEKPTGVSVRLDGLNVFGLYMKSSRKKPFTIEGCPGDDDVYIGDFNTVKQESFDSLKSCFAVEGDIHNPGTTKKWRSPLSTQWNKLKPDSTQKDFVLVPKDGPLSQEDHRVEIGVLGGSTDCMLPNEHHFSDHFLVCRRVGSHKFATLSMSLDQEKPLEFRHDTLEELYAELEKAVPRSVEGLVVGEKSAFLSHPDRAQPNRPCLSAALGSAKQCLEFMSKWGEAGVQEEWEKQWWQGVGATKGDAEFEPLIAFDRACIETTIGMGAEMMEKVTAAVRMWEEAMMG